MKPFTDKATCPKCQSTLGAGIDSAFGDRRYTLAHCDGLDCPILCAETETTRQGGEVIAIKRIPPPEHLHVTCTSCGYEWLMECADAESALEQLKDIEDKLNPAPTVIDVCCPGCLASISYWLHDGEPSLRRWITHAEQQP